MSDCCDSTRRASTVIPKPGSASAAPSQGTQARFHIEQMDCPTEEALLRSKLEPMPGVLGLDFNLLKRTLIVQHELPSDAPIRAAISSLGMSAEPVDTGNKTRIQIQQMDCPTEEKLIRDKLSRLEGVEALEFNLLQRVLTVRHAPGALDRVITAIRELGFTPEMNQDAAVSPPVSPRTAWWPLVIAGLAALGAEVAELAEFATPWAPAALALLAILLGGVSTYKKGWIALKNRNLNINALMSIAVTGAILIGQWPEAAMVMVLFALAEVIEAKSIDRARNAIRGLMEMAPETATVRQNDGSWAEVDSKTVAIGALVRVRPGERIGLDGTLVSGRSSINQAPITGESLPVEKSEGDPVFAGTINESGSFEYRVTAVANNTTLARIIHAVEDAQGARAPTQRFVDRFSKVYTPAVFALAVLVALIPPLLMGEAWFDWVYRALVLLVVACPCALVISTPVTIVSGLAAATRHGILVKGGVYLEAGKNLKVLALDKTGTLTHGKPEQTDFRRLIPESKLDVEDVALRLASRSDHPVSQALVRAGTKEASQRDEVTDFAAIPGRGVQGTLAGERYYLGNHRLMEELGICSLELESELETLEREGKTVVVLASEQQPLGLFAVADTVKPSSRQAIEQLHALGVKTVMLTGDNPHTAQAIARAVGIDEAHGSLLPEDKLKTVESLVNQGGPIGMVGDGINDAPALARADIGFAMGAAGTDTAIETADVALMDDDLRKIPLFIQLSRETSRILIQNITLAIGIKAVFLVFAVLGTATLWMAVLADMGASLLVVANGLRMLRK